MAEEILHSGLAAIRNPSILAKEFLLLLKDRRSFRNHPSLVYAGDAQGTGTTTIKIGALGLQGYDHLTSVAEGAAVANTPLTHTSFPVTVARWAKRYTASDLARITDIYGHLSGPDTFAQDAFLSAELTLCKMMAGLPQGFSHGVGESEQPFSVTDFYAATAQLEMANAQGPFMCLLHNRQIGHFRQSLRSEQGVHQWESATAELVKFRTDGFKGSFLGVDVYGSDFVPTVNAGKDYAGGMWGRGAILWADATIPEDNASPNQVYLGKVMIDFERDGARALKAITVNAYMGVGEGIDDAGVRIVTQSAA